MANNADLQTVMPLISGISPEETLSPYMPIGIYAQEAEDLYTQAIEDKDLLISRGLNQDLIDSLPIRFGALHEAQSLWMVKRNLQTETLKKWKEWVPEAIEFRDELTDEMSYAFRHQDNLLQTVSEIMDGNSNADLIQDLNDLSVLGKSNKELLEKTNFDLELLDKAATFSDDGGAMLAQANGDRNEASPERVLRDQAYTYLKEAVDEIRYCGRFVFRKDKVKLEKYRSEYIRKRHNSTRGSKVFNL